MRYRWSGKHSLWMLLGGAYLLLWLAVITPLTCLIHCAARDHQSMPHDSEHTAMYLCLLGEHHNSTSESALQLPSDTSSLQTPDPAPKAVYASILPLPASNHTPLNRRWKPHWQVAQWRNLVLLPPSPPPESATLSSLR